MKSPLACGALLILGLNILLAGGVRREDIPKYVSTLKAPQAKPADKVKAADMIAKRGAINSKDVQDAIGPLKVVAEKDRDAGARKAAIHALGTIAPDDQEAVTLLIQILKKDQSPDIKKASVLALAGFGPRAKEALPAIRDYGKTLDKKDKRFLQTVTGQIQGVAK